MKLRVSSDEKITEAPPITLHQLPGTLSASDLVNFSIA